MEFFSGIPHKSSSAGIYALLSWNSLRKFNSRDYSTSYFSNIPFRFPSPKYPKIYFAVITPRVSPLRFLQMFSMFFFPEVSFLAFGFFQEFLLGNFSEVTLLKFSKFLEKFLLQKVCLLRFRQDLLDNFSRSFF